MFVKASVLLLLLPSVVLAEDPYIRHLRRESIPVESFYEDFSNGIDSKKWTISTWTAPRSIAANRSSFKLNHVFIKDGMLCLKLSQKRNSDGTFTSSGAEITSTAKFGYGKYEIVMKASSDAEDPNISGNPVSGSITGVSQFLDLSKTEIDIEVEGLAERAALTQTSTWVSEAQPSETYKIPPVTPKDTPHARFHVYKYIWIPGKVKFFRDGVLISTHTEVIPTLPAPMIFNHWGTHASSWGGYATAGVDRYVFIKSFTFTAFKKFKDMQTEENSVK